jgi:hypothetical protein
MIGSVTMSSMKKLQGDQAGMNVLLVPVILLALFFVGAASFAIWAFGSRQDYKNNSDAKSTAAVEANKKVVQAQDAKEFAEAAKKPLKPYIGPEAYGSLRVMYPKTWSAYVDVSDGSAQPLDAYFHADYVPATDMKQTYNLRVRVDAQSYTQLVQQYNGLVKSGKVTAVPYSLPSVKNVAGLRFDGQVVLSDSKSSGTMVILPMRDKTLEIWTESPSYLPDFMNNILPNLTFSP